MSTPAYSLPIHLLRSRADFIDLNKSFGGEGESDLLYDKQAISQALMNIFKTSIGEAGPIFDPEFGSPIYELLQEPFDEITTARLQASIFQAVQRWEPRIEIDFSASFIEQDSVQPGYNATLVYRIRRTGERSVTSFLLPALG